MTDEEIKKLINEAIIRERWHIADQLDTFSIDQNGIPNGDMYYSSTYPINNWEESVNSVTNNIRKLQLSGMHLGEVNFETMEASFTCHQCYAHFTANVLTGDGFTYNNGYMTPIHVCKKKR